MAVNRLLKINSEIQKELSSIITYKLTNPKLEGCFVTITNVDTSNDLSHCKIKISIFPESKKEQAYNGIKNSVSFLRRELAKNIKLRIIPELYFILDEGIGYEDHISKLLKGIKNDGENN